ncbi:hypothetical protein SNEBB_003592 [Seison nebaliae]|nr:hypothetical protein SNEBB_003592 [Seison nebaliae]
MESFPNKSQLNTSGNIINFYEFYSTIDKGNFSLVKLARHSLLSHYVAVKVIDKEKLNKEENERAYLEIESLKKLQKVKEVIRLFQIMETPSMLYLVTEYLPNGNLFKYLCKNGRLNEDDARKLFYNICRSVEKCHSHNIVHRDLKAENILLTENNNIKLCDFGFATSFQKNVPLKSWCGTPTYAAPEVFEGKDHDGTSADIWSLGVLLFTMVSGYLPFLGENDQEIRRQVISCQYTLPFFISKECKDLISRILVYEKEKRFNFQQIYKHTWIRYKKEMNENIMTCENRKIEQGTMRNMIRMGFNYEKIKQAKQKVPYGKLGGIYNQIYHILEERQNFIQKNEKKRKRSELPDDFHDKINLFSLNNSENSSKSNKRIKKSTSVKSIEKKLVRQNAIDVDGKVSINFPTTMEVPKPATLIDRIKSSTNHPWNPWKKNLLTFRKYIHRHRTNSGEQMSENVTFVRLKKNQSKIRSNTSRTSEITKDSGFHSETTNNSNSMKEKKAKNKLLISTIMEVDNESTCINLNVKDLYKINENFMEKMKKNVNKSDGLIMLRPSILITKDSLIHRHSVQ